jgi:hypothetical protein
MSRLLRGASFLILGASKTRGDRCSRMRLGAVEARTGKSACATEEIERIDGYYY